MRLSVLLLIVGFGAAPAVNARERDTNFPADPQGRFVEPDLPGPKVEQVMLLVRRNAVCAPFDEQPPRISSRLKLTRIGGDSSRERYGIGGRANAKTTVQHEVFRDLAYRPEAASNELMRVTLTIEREIPGGTVQRSETNSWMTVLDFDTRVAQTSTVRVWDGCCVQESVGDRPEGDVPVFPRKAFAELMPDVEDRPERLTHPTRQIRSIRTDRYELARAHHRLARLMPAEDWDAALHHALSAFDAYGESGMLPDDLALAQVAALDPVARWYGGRAEAQRRLLEVWHRPGLSFEVWVLAAHRLASSMRPGQQPGEAFPVRAVIWERLSEFGDPGVVFADLGPYAKEALLTELTRLVCSPEAGEEPAMSSAAGAFLLENLHRVSIGNHAVIRRSIGALRGTRVPVDAGASQGTGPWPALHP